MVIDKSEEKCPTFQSQIYRKKGNNIDLPLKWKSNTKLT